MGYGRLGAMSILTTALAFLFIAATAFYLTFDVWIWTSGVALFGSLTGPLLTKWRREKKPKLYGDSQFATEAEQRAGSIKQTRTPF
jgi:hypothetical protein